MSAFSNHLEQALLEHIFLGSEYTPPSGLYLALFTSDPGDDDTGDELGDSNYERQDMADGGDIGEGWDDVQESDDGEGHRVQNSHTIEFPAIADEEITVTHWGLYDDSEPGSGNLLFHGAFEDSRDLKVDDVVSISAGSLKITLK